MKESESIVSEWRQMIEVCSQMIGNFSFVKSNNNFLIFPRSHANQELDIQNQQHFNNFSLKCPDALSIIELTLKHDLENFLIAASDWKINPEGTDDRSMDAGTDNINYSSLCDVK